MTNKKYDVLIIGAGPAGMTAAIYTSRANLQTAMIDKDAPGGKVLKTAEIENWTGFTKVTGPDLAVDMFNHSLAFGAKHLYGEVVDIKTSGKWHQLVLKDNNIIEAKAIIIATGTRERQMGIPGEQELYGTLISYCAVCDGAAQVGKEVLVIGGGNSALEEAIYLTKFVTKVTILYRQDQFKRAEKKTIDKVKNNSKIDVIYNASPQAVKAVKDGIEFTYKDKNNQQQSITGARLFPFIGADPETDFIKFTNVLTDKKYVDAKEDTVTKIKGIFVAGDVRHKDLRQIATAVGDGCVAAQKAIEYVDGWK